MVALFFWGVFFNNTTRLETRRGTSLHWQIVCYGNFVFTFYHFQKINPPHLLTFIFYIHIFAL